MVEYLLCKQKVSSSNLVGCISIFSSLTNVSTKVKKLIMFSSVYLLLSSFFIKYLLPLITWFISFCIKYLLPLIVGIPILSSFIVFFIPPKNINSIRFMGLFSSFLVFSLTFLPLLYFNYEYGGFQFVQETMVVGLTLPFGIDGISIFFVILTTLLIPLCLLASFNSIGKSYKKYVIAFLLMESFLILVFYSRDLLLFYIFSETILFIVLIIVGFWNSREKKIRASYMLFLYALFGSVLMLLAILYIYFRVGATDYKSLICSSFTFNEQRLIWLAFFASYGSKMLILPIKTLLEDQVKAPTLNSIVLIAILLNTGVYSFIRFSSPILLEAALYFKPLIFLICSLSILGVIYASLTAIRQTDLKRIIAYTSIAHMNLIMIGVFSFNLIGLKAAILQTLSHGFVSSALFLIIGVICDRHHTPMVKYYSGLVHTMPIFTIIFLIFTMANIALPGTSSFVGEFLILSGDFKISLNAIFLRLLGIILLGLFYQIVYGNLKNQDFSLREFFVVLPLIIVISLMIICPGIFLDVIHSSVNNLTLYITLSIEKFS